jgi:hypothetical protein
VTEAEIRAYYQQLHDELTANYYAGTSGLTKEQFDTQHAQIWSDMETQLIAEGYLESPTPPHSMHVARLVAINPTAARPAMIERNWEGDVYSYNCLITQDIRNQYAAGQIQAGDFVLAHFDDIDQVIITHKIFKSWS